MYTKEQLYNLPVGRLADIILEQQDELAKTDHYRRQLQRIANMLKDYYVDDNRGRPALTPEQRAQAYEDYKRKKRERYAAEKAAREAEGENKQF